MNSKLITFTVMMAALGNVLSFIPIGLTQVGQVGFDLSHIATFIAAIFGGPLVGCLVGFAGGVVAGIYFGPMGWLSWLGLIGIPIGKALTGLTTGAFFRLFKIDERTHCSSLTIPAVLTGYIPEFLFTVFFFLVLVPYFLGWLNLALLVSIAVKAWMEMVVMSVLMAALVGNMGFSVFIVNFLKLHKTDKMPYRN
ncbi:MAG: ECF transporter S component [Candidatus Bathyarchaeia archaeon]